MFDLNESATLLPAYVMNDDESCVHGYSIDSDLSKGKSVSDLIYLSLIGELPTERQRAAFDVGYMFLAFQSPGDASIHGASLSKRMGAPSLSVINTLLLSLSDQACAWSKRHIDVDENRFCDHFQTEQSCERTAFLVERLKSRGVINFLDERVSRLEIDSALFHLFYAIGFRESFHFETIFLHAKSTPAIAEAMAAPLGNRDYPFQLPMEKNA